MFAAKGSWIITQDSLRMEMEKRTVYCRNLTDEKKTVVGDVRPSKERKRSLTVALFLFTSHIRFTHMMFND